ncbi:MAG: hypothetical protein HDQ88_04360 [Clostridia bacterium]|nr:hypothetical protein [Clostridia bacterium]
MPTTDEYSEKGLIEMIEHRIRRKYEGNNVRLTLSVNLLIPSSKETKVISDFEKLLEKIVRALKPRT